MITVIIIIIIIIELIIKVPDDSSETNTDGHCSSTLLHLSFQHFI